jgi:DNA-binding NtrC family response regulator
MTDSAPLARTILVVDDQIGETGSLQQRSFLRNYGNLPYTFVFESCKSQGVGYDPDQALQAVVREGEIDLVLLDLKFGDDDDLLGLPILKRLVARWADLPVMVMSSVDRDVDILGQCLEEGALGFVEKHKSPEYLRTAIERAFDLMNSHVLVGQSLPLRELRRQAARLSPYDQIPVLILGERGTGKERVARYIHQNGPRRQGPFVAVNCGGVPETLFESEFFGAEKGSFTGSSRRISGCLERAHGGTLFLDEVGTLPASMQIKLLRVLQERSYTSLGGGEERRSNFQLLSATNADTAMLVKEGALREDFLDRIAAVTIRTPPLRDCMEDLPLLVEHFLTRFGAKAKSLSPAAFTLLRQHAWPGNMRELQRKLQEALVRSEGATQLEAKHFGATWQVSATSESPFPPIGLADGTEPHLQRICRELEFALEVKRMAKEKKGERWKAEFMRLLYPHSQTQNAKGFSDMVNRLTEAPFGEPKWKGYPEISRLMQELLS